MATILLVNFDAHTTIGLSEILRLRKHIVSAMSAQAATSDLMQRLDAFDLVIADVSSDDQESWRIIERVRQFRRQHGPKPMMLFVSRVYRGPRFELDLEGKGGRVIYVG